MDIKQLQTTADKFLKTVSQDVTDDAARKAEFHRLGKQLLKGLAERLGYSKDMYDIRSNKAGPAVSGEVTLHADDLYIWFSQSMGNRMGITYRTCQGRKDYTGGRNNFLPFDVLRDFSSFVQTVGNIR